ncbi:serine protease htra3 [Limosa lapponica baueri]|uniref:Serine protease htra3 n=1 Tax=Limosa lapponica baueri TaxID=1758121 RepID=A0A2I0U5G7_LIMLA|nr:serine protease htra3 [Limosa lapponica baueri]
MRVSLLSPLLLLSLGCSPGAAELSAVRAKCPTRCDVSKCPSPSCPSGYVPDRCNCCLICAAGEGDSCGRKEDPPCGDSLDCRYPMGKRFAKGVCQCKLSAQVCGSDGRTYDNICQLKAVSRKALQHGLPAVAQVQKGACESGHLQLSSPRYKFNFIADVVEKIAPAVVHIELFLSEAPIYCSLVSFLQYGNSGGPLVNLDGEVIGINTLKVTAGISFAIPSDRITQFLTESHDKQSKDGKKRFIGIRMLTITPALVEELKHNNADFPDVRSGIYVHEVVPNSPSHRGGIQDGDIIVKVNGRPLMTSSDLQEAVMNESPLLLEVRRGNDDLLFNIEPEVVM